MIGALVIVAIAVLLATGFGGNIIAATSVKTRLGRVPLSLSGNARQVESEILSPVDKWAQGRGLGVTITRGFSTPEDNRRVGGDPESCHLDALAVDLTTTPALAMWDLLAWGQRNLRFGEMFLERNRDGSLSHVHVTAFPCGGSMQVGILGTGGNGTR